MIDQLSLKALAASNTHAPCSVKTKASESKHEGRLIAQRLSRSGFTLIENIVAIGIVGFLFSAIYAAMAMNMSLIQMCRNNETATQILAEKLDAIRLYSWEQINSNSFIPRTFTVGIDPSNTNSAAYYTGKLAIAEAPISESYKTNLMLVTVELKWSSGRRLQTRSMSSYVAKDGLESLNQ